jgi:hypothetical protein
LNLEKEPAPAKGTWFFWLVVASTG